MGQKAAVMRTTSDVRRRDLIQMAAVGLATAMPMAAPALRTAGPIVVVSHHGVRSSTTSYLGVEALTLELTDEEQARQSGRPLGDRPAHALVPDVFRDGVIEVDIAGDLNGRGSAAAAGGVGVVFRRGDDARFDAVQLFLENGGLNHPPPPAPRLLRAIRYASHSGSLLESARGEALEVHERSAPIGPARWHRLRLDITGRRLVAGIDGQHVLTVNGLGLDRAGRVGLWVGDGTRGRFANLSVTPAATASDPTLGSPGQA